MSNVLIIGDVMLDHYILGECSRISPEAPVPVVNIKEEEWRLGGAANVASNLVALNTKCTLISIIGDDGNSAQFDFLLKSKELIKNKLFKSSSRPTTVKSRVLVSGHQMIRLDKERTFQLTEEEENAVLESFLLEVEQAELILISDYNKGLLSKKLLQIIFRTASELGIPIIVDPKSADFSLYKGATCIKPNMKEAEQATGIKITDSASLEYASKKIKAITSAEIVITTLSEDGVGLFTNNSLYIIPTKAQKVFDVTGAGDTYLAAFAYEYLKSGDEFAACEFANFAAGVVVGKVGSSTASLKEINQIKSEFSYYEH